MGNIFSTPLIYVSTELNTWSDFCVQKNYISMKSHVNLVVFKNSFKKDKMLSSHSLNGLNLFLVMQSHK